MKHIALSMVALALLAVRAPAADPKPPTVEALIEQLGSKVYAARERASRALQARGAAALPAVQKALAHPDPEVRERLERMLPGLKLAAALEPKRVTLTAEKQTLTAALQEIEKQTGFKLQANGAAPETKFDFSCKNVPFWDAIERVRREAGCRVTAEPREKFIRLDRGSASSPLVSVTGPFRLELVHFHEDRDIFFAEAGIGKELGRRNHWLTLTFDLLVEPHYSLFAVEKGWVETAKDENNASLIFTPPVEGKSELSQQSDYRAMFRHPVQVTLQRSSATAKTIRDLTGTIPVHWVIEKKLLVVSEDLTQAVGKTVTLGSDALKVMECQADGGGGLSVRFSAPLPQAGPSPHWHERVFLEDEAGVRFQQNGSGTSQSGNEYSFSIEYGKPNNANVGPPKKLLIEDWITVVHPLAFSFKDVPLP